MADFNFVRYIFMLIFGLAMTFVQIVITYIIPIFWPPCWVKYKTCRKWIKSKIVYWFIGLFSSNLLLFSTGMLPPIIAPLVQRFASFSWYHGVVCVLSGLAYAWSINYAVSKNKDEKGNIKNKALKFMHDYNMHFSLLVMIISVIIIDLFM